MIAVFLDAGPFSNASRVPGKNAEADALQAWLKTLTEAGVSVHVAEITDYEVRRELIREDKRRSLERLDAFGSRPNRYVPITTEAMRLAAELWAQSRRVGQVTAPPEAIDADVILAAQVRVWAEKQGIPLPEIVVATTNVKHIGLFVQASLWRDIQP